VTIRELIDAAAMNPAEAARYLGISRRTLRRYLATDRAPRASLEALRRARWVAPEAAEYLQYLGVLRGIEYERNHDHRPDGPDSRRAERREIKHGVVAHAGGGVC